MKNITITPTGGCRSVAADQGRRKRAQRLQVAGRTVGKYAASRRRVRDCNGTLFDAGTETPKNRVD